MGPKLATNWHHYANSWPMNSADSKRLFQLLHADSRRELRSPTMTRIFLVIFVIVIFTGCDWGRESAPCDCAEFEAAVDSINWAPGLTHNPIGTESAGGEGEWVVQRVWVTEESEHLLDRLEAALNEVGFEVDSSESRRLNATSGSLTIWAGSNESVGENEEEFFVRATAPKGESGEAYDHMRDLADVLLAAS